jgi:hypothetical protein
MIAEGPVLMWICDWALDYLLGGGTLYPVS